ncbi:hypothetical protein CRI77_22195 [Mycolicibacterium duvalii]|uniref:Uncharacterized protein n=1 Tax=Mycolicibacterium duvalii TaxID=39688 RepID=A0A7I7K2Z6_9MYCO|nr:hypothetical protein [Mycolicibacterium duvalii]MCV7366971.1 hypothetical protein [Mycolicibacterium duvalii]PEG36874.1 hypothetical protein CRI77_22195 [Mycolicibacterium duvalii]BBX17938.1 hypothetical protein MDUV_27980 [Mycolicibacterium duvalii]
MPVFTPDPARTSCCPACGYPTLNASLCHACGPFAAQLSTVMPLGDTRGAAAGGGSGLAL